MARSDPIGIRLCMVCGILLESRPYMIYMVRYLH